MILRRFEIYSLSPSAPKAAVETFKRASRDCARFIPEVLHSAIGTNRSDVPLHLSWEQSYASPAAYLRYMEHPFHANRLDRFLMADNPENITTDNDYGVGLIGYRCETPVYYIPGGGARRVVMLRLADGAEQRFGEIAARAKGRGGMSLSTFNDNFFGSHWLDGETYMGYEPKWSHIWEQGFPTLDAALAYKGDWAEEAGAMVESTIDVVYELETGHGYDKAIV